MSARSWSIDLQGSAGVSTSRTLHTHPESLCYLEQVASTYTGGEYEHRMSSLHKWSADELILSIVIACVGTEDVIWHAWANANLAMGTPAALQVSRPHSVQSAAPGAMTARADALPLLLVLLVTSQHYDLTVVATPEIPITCATAIPPGIVE